VDIIAEHDGAKLVHMSEEEYHADPCDVPSLSQSIAHTLVARSPFHAWRQHPRLGGKPKTPNGSMDFGSVVHALLLGVGKEYVVLRAADGTEFEDLKTKAAQRARDEARAAGKVPILAETERDALALAAVLRERLADFGVELSGRSELSVFWHEKAKDGTLVPCRGRLDHWREDIATIYDLKIVKSGHPKACQSHLVGFGGDIQAAAYVSAMSRVYPELAGRLRFVFLFCETETGTVTPAIRGASLRDLGNRRWRRAVETWARCMKTAEWPAYVRATTPIEAPQWALYAEEDLSFSEGWSDGPEPDGPSDGTDLEPGYVE
jgi:hypothetical protein